MKIYVITLAQFFPVGHSQSGNETNFKYEFLLGQHCPDCEVEQDLSGEEISRCNSCIRACFTSETSHHTSQLPNVGEAH